MDVSYRFTLIYRPIDPAITGGTPDERPIYQLPALSFGPMPDDTARAAAIADESARLESGGYQIARVDRHLECQTCDGAGHVYQKPKGWRKRRPPTQYECTRVTCRDCRGVGTFHEYQTRQDTIERILDAAARPCPAIVEVIEMEGSNGQWYGPHGFPIGVQYVGRMRSAGYVYQDTNGTTYGVRYSSRQDAIDKHAERTAAARAEFAEHLAAADDDALRQKFVYWLSQRGI